ncbi:MAG TPA: sigma-70 family RNA polymerase sigma factor [Acidimicrobiia bacterium]|nr:sigma-70 family RNA polymerase sigma factor [Acidimicrobiia bacterium]
MAIASPIRSGRFDDDPKNHVRPAVTLEDLWVHREYLHAVSRGIVGDSATADDVVQETYVRALCHLDDLDPAQPVRAWLATVARRCSIDELRRMARQAVPVDEIPEVHTPRAGGALDEVLARSDVRAAHRALGELHERERRLLLGQVAQGRSIADLAAEDGSTPRAVESVLSRARTKLASAIDRGAWGVAPLSALLARMRRQTTAAAARLSAADPESAVLGQRTTEWVTAAVAIAVLGSALVIGHRTRSDDTRVETTERPAPDFVPQFTPENSEPLADAHGGGAARRPTPSVATAPGFVGTVADLPWLGDVWAERAGGRGAGGGSGDSPGSGSLVDRPRLPGGPSTPGTALGHQSATERPKPPATSTSTTSTSTTSTSTTSTSTTSTSTPSGGGGGCPVPQLQGVCGLRAPGEPTNSR